jgi:cell wall-associated NlpC family hydrolase
MKGGFRLHFSSSRRMWFGSAVLSGLLLVGSFPVSAAAKVATTDSKSVTSVRISMVAYPKTVRSQLKWTHDPILSQVVAAKDTSSVALASSVRNATDVGISSAQTQPDAQAAVITQRPVEVAAISPKQVSRSDSSQIIDHALSLQGVPYHFGGTSRSGFDCSGFTQYVYSASNTALPRTASEQFNVGSSVSRDQLKEGDLVFFSTYSAGPSHVGIYIGGGRFIHASNSGVRITSLSDSYYTSRYLGARRIN